MMKFVYYCSWYVSADIANASAHHVATSMVNWLLTIYIENISQCTVQDVRSEIHNLFYHVNSCTLCYYQYYMTSFVYNKTISNTIMYAAETCLFQFCAFSDNLNHKGCLDKCGQSQRILRINLI